MLGPVSPHCILRPTAPQVKLLDLREDTSDLTTYTFANCVVSPTGGTADFNYNTNDPRNLPRLRSTTRSAIVVIVHAEDALATFGVSSVTLGGVSGVERVDRGGGTNAINTAIYSWTTDIIEGITNTDIVVTFSEAVTGCAVAVIEVSNIGPFFLMSVSAQTATGPIGLNGNGAQEFISAVAVIGSTMITGAGSEVFTFSANSNPHSNFYPVMLYEASNSEFAYAGGYAINKNVNGQYGVSEFRISVDWSGATAGDAAAVFIG